MNEIDKKLIEAAKVGDAEGIKKALSEGADINAKDNQGEIALFYFISYIVGLGIGKDGVIDADTVKRISEAEKNNIGMIKFLIEKGTDVNSKDEYGFPLIHNPARWGLKLTLELFIKAGARDLSEAMLFIGSGYPFNVEAAKVLVKAGADINYKGKNGFTPLIYAAGHGNLELIKYLVENGADIFAKTESGKSAMSNSKSTHYFHEDVYNYLKEKMKENKHESSDEVAKIVKKGSLKKLKELIEKGASIESLVEKKSTLLMIALNYGQKEIVDFLIKNGANVKATDENKSTPLHCAAARGDLESAKLLVSKGADINAKDSSNKTPLMTAAGCCEKEMVEFLVSKDAKINLKDTDGKNELMWAALNGSLEIVKFLLAHGADANIKDEYGNTALSLAKDGEFKKVVDYLNPSSQKNEREKRK